MFVYPLKPRFNDTDALGHLNHTALLTWFEEGRRPLFELFVPDLDPQKWNLIIARVEVDYLAQGEYSKDAVVHTWLEKIGNSSMVVVQEALQDSTPIVRGKSVMVHFDYRKNKSVPIPDVVREKLKKHVQ